MKRKSCQTSAIIVVACILCMTLRAQETHGFKYNNLTLSPFVNLAITYDSNVDIDRKEYDDWFFTVNPGLDLSYIGNDWGLKGNIWYAYDKYAKYTELNESRYGGSLSEFWESPKGLRIVLGQRYIESKANDSILDGGRGVWRERKYWELTGAASYQVTEKTGVTLSGQWSENSYHNDADKYGQLYGWDEWSVGLELARKLTQKSNVLLAGGYQRYTSKGTSGIGSGSTGYSVMGGLGSRATERISYRLLTGVSWFDYADGDRTADMHGQDSDMIVGWTYSADADWLISRKWAFSLAGSSYFQPSETQQNQASQVYTLSAGLTYRPVQRVTVTGDVGLRREEDQFDRWVVDANQGAYRRKSRMSEDIWSGRLRVNYEFIKYASVYAGLEYTDWQSDERGYDYDRFLGTLGLKLRY